ncbi:protein phosphatase 1 regulatory subunit 1C [Falco biarmicus]|uniref:protein phosphatase 1 regulatory subunit 1C n=1 Tax=Falco cherrug TaxID=345164 RepID=UPI000FFB38BA|nr:protein phosphatase 1 regulatory subunit 1C [Falco cherrug]XP_037254101.1 protein phosphatase 1 regulatory subunit 1C [Falco rusticolus]XP_040459737.1 protein phosphatase 1 regulatory subunit 1C [Falco naumanni]XP_056206203.1 protein phosphatase 1 regulatory subunit 1C [Falco biarmicus]
MWNKGVAGLTQIPVLGREVRLLRGALSLAAGRAPGRGAHRLAGSSLLSPLTHLGIAMEPNSPKKIQFAVPLFQSQIDPEAAEQIRKRRPTPASLVIMNEHVPPEKDEKRTNISQAESQSASPKQRKQSVFTPPALKGIKHLKSQSESAFPEEEEGVSEREEEWGH